MVQGTSENAAHRIAKNGFGTVATLDHGYYGQGMYLTSRMAYAAGYAYNAVKDEKGKPLVFVVCLVIPGNPLPISEPPHTENQQPNPTGFLGKPCWPGYESHYTTVDVSGDPLKEPHTAVSPDELVVFSPSQVLPLFLVYTDRHSEFSMALSLVSFFVVDVAKIAQLFYLFIYFFFWSFCRKP